MKSSSPPPSSSSSSPDSSSATAQLLSSSSAPSPLLRLSLRSPELQAEFLQECRNKFQSHGDFSESSILSSPSSSSPPFSPSPSSPLPSPFSPSPSSPLPSPFSPSPSSSPFSPSPSSPGCDSRQARLSLSSPELLSELRESRTRPLRHVPAHNRLTTVFSGRGGRGAAGGQASGPAHSTRPANQTTSR